MPRFRAQLRPYLGPILAVLVYLLSTPLIVKSFLAASKSASPFPGTTQIPVQAMSRKLPVLFLSHGGPNLFEDYTHPAYAQLQTFGKQVTRHIRPKAVVVVSAHWQGGSKTIEVNTATEQGLIYDYYGFPPHYYTLQYPNKGSPDLAAKVLSLLDDARIEAEGVRRGLDHGVFAPFLVAFNPDSNPLDIPIVQVSLFDSDNVTQQFALGRALAPLRDQDTLIICSGMAVHNIRDMVAGYSKPGYTAPYAASFDQALKEALDFGGGKEKVRALERLVQRSDAKKAHPSLEHLMPLIVAAGAAEEGEKGERLWTLVEGGGSWAQYRFGEMIGAGS